MDKKYTVTKQVFKMLLSILGADFLSIFISLMLMGITDKYTIAKVITQALVLWFYAIWIFGAAYDCATTDHKTYVPLKPFASKGFILSIAPVAFVGLTWIFYFICWKTMPMESNFIPITTIATALYIFSTSPFFEIIQIAGAKANLVGQICAIVVPVILCVLGYYSGFVKWDYTKYLKVIMFEKKKKK